MDVLDFLFSDKRLISKLVLKGGTAINLLCTNLKRLSVDIDLDFIGTIDPKKVQIERAEILSLIERHLEMDDYYLSAESRNNYALSSQTFLYRNASGNMDTIKIEINFLNRIHVLEPIKTSFTKFGKIHKVTALRKEELYGSKIAALIDRTKPRDLYDIYQFVCSGSSVDSAGLLLSLLFYLSIDDIYEFPGAISPKIDAITYKDIRAELKPVLAKDDSFLLSEAKSVVKDFLLKISLTENEKSFLLSAKNKIFDFGLLSSNHNFVERMSNHPMVLWKKSQKSFKH